MSMMEAYRCRLCEANGHAVEMVEYSTQEGKFYCPCCDRLDRQYKGLAAAHDDNTDTHTQADTDDN